MPENRRKVALIAAVVVVIALSLPITVGPHIERRLMNALGERFGGHAEIESISVSFLPRPRVRGRGLVLRQKSRTDVPPLIKIASFSAEAGPIGFLRRTIRIGRVDLEGLEINVPPGGMDVDDDEGTNNPDEKPDRSPLVVAALRSEHATLNILRSTPGKAPRVFEIEHLAMENVGAEAPWPFRAALTNPTPPGAIETQGTFGPWNIKVPARTPLAADYRFEHANLGVFDGIQGILASSGRFSGVLERIEVDGQTSVPDFALSDVGNAVPLDTRFHAIVDGTNGNTLLQPVDAKLLNTSIHTSGGVVEPEGEDGRTVKLDVQIKEGALEDILRLAAKGDQPPMSGVLTLEAAFVLPPGDEDVIRKLRLDGTFGVASARFSKPAVQAKVDEFSTKARGVRDETPDPVVSNFRGAFNMAGGTIRFSRVAFSMPGARVNVAGHYVMETSAIDFRGTVRLDAKLSSLTSGIKSVLLKMFDGLFRHEDVTVIPITIGGTADEPKVRLDFGKVLSGG